MISTSLFLSFVIAFALGWVSQKLGLCLVLAMRRFIAHKPMLLITLASCGIIGMLLSPIYRSFGFSYQFYWPDELFIIMILGGMIFGVGAALNNGCNVGSITRLTRGDTSMLVTIFGWIVGEIIWRTMFNPTGTKQFSEPIMLDDNRFLMGAVIISLPALLVWRRRREKRIWIYTTLLGVLASALFIVEPLWTPSSYVFDVAQSWTNADVDLGLNRTLTFAALLLGMLAQSLYRKTFQLRGFGWQDSVHHLFAGVLMGVGASMALGGNDSQILLVFPTLTLAAVVPLISMCLGIWMTLMFNMKFIETEKA